MVQRHTFVDQAAVSAILSTIRIAKKGSYSNFNKILKKIKKKQKKKIKRLKSKNLHRIRSKNVTHFFL